MEFSNTALVLLGLLLAGWTLAALWLVLSARARARKAETARKNARRLARMIEDAPAAPLLVRADGRIEGPPRLASWLGLDAMPGYLSELSQEQGGLDEAGLASLTEAVRNAQKLARPVRLTITPRGSQRSLSVHGNLADPQLYPGGAALLWVFDYSDSATELVQLRHDAARAREDFSALVGLIEAAPLPMWFRGPDARLQLVNSAYVNAVGAESGPEVVAGQIELVESVDGLTPAQIAAQASAQGMAIERIVTATIEGERRSLRVSDLPLGTEGIAGYALDIEDVELQARELRAFREAQRSMLDQLSEGVAQFDAEHRLAFANLPFHRLFALPASASIDPPDFEGLLDMMRDAGRLPEVRDYPAWRRELSEWFHQKEPQEDAWPLRDGTHLRIVAHPMPDGGLVLIAEDRTEQLAVSATRDTLLRTRTATFDSLFESLAVFAPDGRMELWNRRFAADWGLDDSFLDQHPRIEALLEKIAEKLERPAQHKAIGDVVRAATLDRQQQGGRVALKDGRVVEFGGVPLPDGNGLLTVLDITDSQKAEQALRERNAALEEADALKTRFLANMSYEFRTPLTSIGGFAELLQAGVAGDLSEQGREYVAAILESVGRLGEQIESVLDLTQSEAGLLPLALEEVELLPFVTRIVRERETAIKAGGLTLDLRGDKSAGKVSLDQRRMGRALGHLLDNAIAATPEGGRILVELSRRKTGARIVISDNGRGMDEKEAASALDGVRLAPDGQGVERRQGLGLPLARKLIEDHGGRVELMSEKGAGTTVTVLLP